MRICYVLLSPTFGMHQYTADLANRMAQADHQVHLVTTRHYPRDRYLPAVIPHTPVATRKYRHFFNNKEYAIFTYLYIVSLRRLWLSIQFE